MVSVVLMSTGIVHVIAGCFENEDNRAEEASWVDEQHH